MMAYSPQITETRNAGSGFRGQAPSDAARKRRGSDGGRARQWLVWEI